jgi:fructokinase
MIAVGGEALVDLVIAPDGGVTAKLGGGPYNVARTLGRLGMDVGFLASISTDRFGTELFDAMVADGVQPHLTVRCDEPTTLAAAQLDESGSATYRFYLEGTSAPALSTVPALGAHDVTAVHVGTLGLVLQPMATTLEEFVGEHSASALVMLDPNCRPSVPADRRDVVDRIWRVAEHAHVVKLSVDDAEYLHPGGSPTDLAAQCLDRGVKVVLLTAGGDGTIVHTSGDVTTIAAERVEVADTIGAGDSFCGAFLAAWLTSGRAVRDLDDHHAVVAAARAANQVAAITCSRVGADPPWRRELPDDWGVG